MSDTMTITSEEIEAVAAKLDAGEALDKYDRVILRAVFIMAGSSAADALGEDGDDVDGFQAGGIRPMESFSLNFAVPGDGSVKGSFSWGASRVSMQDFHFVMRADKSSPG